MRRLFYFYTKSGKYFLENVFGKINAVLYIRFPHLTYEIDLIFVSLISSTSWLWLYSLKILYYFMPLKNV